MHRYDEAIEAVLADMTAASAGDDELVAEARRSAGERGATTETAVADLLVDAYLPIDDANGRLLHALTRARRPGRVVEFGTSMGMSAIHIAAALTDDEPPLVATELEPSKVERAERHLRRAGLSQRVEIRCGDALDTLSGFTDPISLLFLDGWKGLYLPVLRLLEDHLVDGAMVVADDTELLAEQCRPYLDHVRGIDTSYTRGNTRGSTPVSPPGAPSGRSSGSRPGSSGGGYWSVGMPVGDGMEISVRVGP